MYSIFSGLAYDEPIIRGLKVRSAIGYEYSIGEPEIEAFEALPIPGIPVDEARVLSLKLYRGEEAVIVTPAGYEFRKPLVDQAKYVVFDGRRVNWEESSRIKYLKEYRHKPSAFIGVPEEFSLPLLLSGIDVVFVGDEPKYLEKAPHSYYRKKFVEIVEENPIALRFLRLLERDTVYHNEKILGSLTALERPEVANRIEKIRSSYVPPEGDALILLPCSMKKPYSLSKTHKPIVEITKRYRVHELIITSPLIVVPRELETIFPAISYDHPPTGKRTYGEKGAVAIVLKKLLRRYEDLGYKHFIAFLPKDYREALDLVDYPIDIYKGDKLNVSRLKRKLDELKARGELRENIDRVGMAKNVLRFLYDIEPPNVERYIDRIALEGKTFGVWKEGIIKPKRPMLERLYKEGIYIKAPSNRIEDIKEISGNALAGLYIPRERKQLRSARLTMSMRAIRKVLDIAKGIYATD